MAQETQTGILYQPSGVDGEGAGREVLKGGDIFYIYIWLIYVEI